ncbi:oligosaccharide flippase family protein [Aeromonas veronii]
MSLFNEGKYLVLSSFFLIGFVRTNQMMVDNFLGSESLAYYSMPIKIVDGFTILITTYVSAIYPYLLSSIKGHGKSKAAEVYFGSIAKGGLVIAFFLYFFAEKIILTIFGEQYIESISVLKIYSIALFFNGLFISSGRWFIALEQQNFVAWRNFIAFSLNVLMSYILIPHYGIDGAALSALVSWSIAGYLSFMISNENRWLMIAIPKSIFKFNKPL